MSAPHQIRYAKRHGGWTVWCIRDDRCPGATLWFATMDAAFGYVIDHSLETAPPYEPPEELPRHIQLAWLAGAIVLLAALATLVAP